MYRCELASYVCVCMCIVAMCAVCCSYLCACVCVHIVAINNSYIVTGKLYDELGRREKNLKYVHC